MMRSSSALQLPCAVAVVLAALTAAASVDAAPKKKGKKPTTASPPATSPAAPPTSTAAPPATSPVAPTPTVTPPAAPTPAAPTAPPAVTPTLTRGPVSDTLAAPVRLPRERGGEIFSIQVGPEVGARHFRYTDGVTSNLRRYDLGAAPLVSASAGLYPFAGMAGAVDGGIFGDYASQAIALSSATASGSALDSAWWRFHAGARVRARLGTALVLGVSAAYGGETFAFSASALDPQVPAVAYRFVRPQVDARYAIGRFAIAGAVGYDVVVSSGAVSDRFPHAKVGGLETSIGPTFAVTRAWEVGLTASYRRFFYAMHPVPGDAFVAGGALDEMLGAQASVAYVF